ncbi:MAG: formylglycine-generating enzyme family protein [Magnetococcales bacterium]|nr:formylglycine-generating enzyme family protein [Magnetococcales bacterium]
MPSTYLKNNLMVFSQIGGRVVFLLLLLVVLPGCPTQPMLAVQAMGTAKGLNMEFVAIPGGVFEMGCGSWQKDCDEDEKPTRKVTLGPYEIGKYEVTQKQWLDTMGSNPSEFLMCGKECPVEQVSWKEIQIFIGKLNGLGYGKFRLPTEAEWEYACRSGGKPEPYCGGTSVDEVAWYDVKAKSPTSPVGQKRPNGLGLYDMSGNVWEWVADRYCIADDNEESEWINPICEDATSGQYVLRGGSWFNSAQDVRSTGRNRNSPDYKNVNLGFRLVRLP